jgi:predicted GNAT family acetyltransferase
MRRLIHFANTFREPAGPGREVVDTPRYRATLQPDYPIPGPNSVAWIRCASADTDEVITEARTLFAPRGQAFMWILDPGTEPPDFPDYLAAAGVFPEPHAPAVDVMVLSVEAHVEAATFEIHDALADIASFRAADAVNAEAFGDSPRQPDAQERRRLHQLEAGNRRVFLVTIDGEPAGSAGMTLYPPSAAIINGGAVRSKFRGRGIYRAMVAARLAIAREAGVAGLVVWGGPMSAPILRKLGFETVGWRKFYLDTSTRSETRAFGSKSTDQATRGRAFGYKSTRTAQGSIPFTPKTRR